jgi:hypothetical protein
VVLLQSSAEAFGEIKSESVDRIVTDKCTERCLCETRAQLLAGRFPSTSQPNEGLGSDILFDGGHLHYFTYRSLRLLLERGGFRMVSRQAYGRFGFIHAVYPPLTSVGVQWVAARHTALST